MTLRTKTQKNPCRMMSKTAKELSHSLSVVRRPEKDTLIKEISSKQEPEVHRRNKTLESFVRNFI